MVPGISSLIFLPHTLTTVHLDALAATGARAIELVGARWHVDAADRAQVRELAQWFRAHEVTARLAAPAFFELEFSRHRGPSLDLLHHDRGRRIDAMDEVKRAIELGEQVPLTACVLALGTRETRWSEATLDHALSVVEHLRAFAAPLGVRLELATAANDFATPEHLLEVLTTGHFTTCGICLDVATAAQFAGELEAALAGLGPRLTALHVSDRAAGKQDRLWPATGSERSAQALRGSLDWAALYATLEALPAGTPGVLVVSDMQAGSPGEVASLGREVWSHRARLAEERAAADEAARARA